MAILKLVFATIKKIIFFALILLVVFKLIYVLSDYLKDEKDVHCSMITAAIAGSAEDYLKKNPSQLDVSSKDFFINNKPRKYSLDYYVCPKSSYYNIKSDGKTYIIVSCPYHGDYRFSMLPYTVKF